MHISIIYVQLFTLFIQSILLPYNSRDFVQSIIKNCDERYFKAQKEMKEQMSVLRINDSKESHSTLETNQGKKSLISPRQELLKSRNKFNISRCSSTKPNVKPSTSKYSSMSSQMNSNNLQEPSREQNTSEKIFNLKFSNKEIPEQHKAKFKSNLEKFESLNKNDKETPDSKIKSCYFQSYNQRHRPQTPRGSRTKPLCVSSTSHHNEIEGDTKTLPTRKLGTHQNSTENSHSMNLRNKNNTSFTSEQPIQTGRDARKTAPATTHIPSPASQKSSYNNCKGKMNLSNDSSNNSSNHYCRIPRKTSTGSTHLVNGLSNAEKKLETLEEETTNQIIAQSNEKKISDSPLKNNASHSLTSTLLTNSHNPSQQSRSHAHETRFPSSKSKSSETRGFDFTNPLSSTKSDTLQSSTTNDYKSLNKIENTHNEQDFHTKTTTTNIQYHSYSSQTSSMAKTTIKKNINCSTDSDIGEISAKNSNSSNPNTTAVPELSA